MSLGDPSDDSHPCHSLDMLFVLASSEGIP